MRIFILATFRNFSCVPNILLKHYQKAPNIVEY